MTPINIPISARSLVNLTNSNIGLLAKLTLKIFVQVQARSARSNQFQNSQVNQVTKKADKRLFLNKKQKLYFWCSMHSFRYY